MIRLGRRVANKLGSLYKKIIVRIPNPIYADQKYLLRCFATRGVPLALDYRHAEFKASVLAFVRSMSEGDYQYRYSPSVACPTLYSSVYACLILSLFGELEQLTTEERRGWADYFDSFQSPHDGLFRDNAVLNKMYEECDWWGARHLIPHIMAAYAALGTVPKHKFFYLDRFKSCDAISQWLDKEKWDSAFPHSNDVDNKIMNIACSLQYERDFRGDASSGDAASFIKNYLAKKVDAKTGLWGSVDVADRHALSRGVQFAYHLYSIYFYDGDDCLAPDTIVDYALTTQNYLGGYGVMENASACEDIDSLDLLCRLTTGAGNRTQDVRSSVRRSLAWMFSNQNGDGGFVFRRNEPMVYGHSLMSSGKNESAMFPTWFRTLAIAYALDFLGGSYYQFIRCPGYQFSGTRA
jgi:prenyltransferase beta subunit